MQPNTKGALLMMASMAAFTLNDTCIKATGGTIPLPQLLTLRGVLATLMLYALARQLGALHLRVSRRDAFLIALRSASEVAAAFFFVTALLNMPLANVTAVLQVLPLTVTLGAALFFGETVGWRRISAIALGFCGMLLIVRPGPDGFSIHALYALGAVACVTVRDLSTRRMSAEVPSMLVTLAASASVLLVAAPMSLAGDWVPVGARDMALIVASSVFILLAYSCSVMVMRVGEVGAVAPFRYTGLVWALVLGWLVFGDWPDTITLIGVAIVAAAGLFTLYREQAQA
ncbi:DMT family transporter [Seohaeicola saemankumensis]|nr:DMT family transporter [Seohaeicola saemankumensis]MCA0873963.1 DMT family transporter [Seohaeicola saemankumensis]